MREEELKKMKNFDNKDVMKKLEQYGIKEGDYDVKINVYHSEEKRGVPYLTLVVNKPLPENDQANLETDIFKIDSGLCVVFAK